MQLKPEQQQNQEIKERFKTYSSTAFGPERLQTKMTALPDSTDKENTLSELKEGPLNSKHFSERTETNQSSKHLEKRTIG